ncbi:PadR family transcriptional regulator [Nonomuraea sp. NPDC050394]|uniref:PadR family transcriptional regulator n=1 Tax=Nonomuraea sp. NPDC050394 TaxID=3364363 RepID=UPI00379E808E
MKPTERRSALGLVVLVALHEEPMHAYRIHALIKARGKDRLVNVRGRASIYQAIDRLQRLGLIAVRESGSVDKRPERRVYEITKQGRETTGHWLKEMLTETGNEFPEFLVGVSFLTVLTPEEVQRELTKRAQRLQTELDALDAAFQQAGDVPRVFMLEEELRRASVRTELGWIGSVLDDLRTKRISWNDQWLMEIAAKYNYQIDDREEPET